MSEYGKVPLLTWFRAHIPGRDVGRMTAGPLERSHPPLERQIDAVL